MLPIDHVTTTSTRPGAAPVDVDPSARHGSALIRFGRPGSPQDPSQVGPAERAPGSSLTYLHFLMDRIARADCDAGHALSAMGRVGREIHDVLRRYTAHFQLPTSAPMREFCALGCRASVDDVRNWLNANFVSGSGDGSTEVRIEIPTWLGILPTNPLYSLVLEHLYARVHHSQSPDRLTLAMSEQRRRVLIEIREDARTSSTRPIMDESFFELWLRVINMVLGSFSWFQLPRSGTYTSSHAMLISYPIDFESQFSSPRQRIEAQSAPPHDDACGASAGPHSKSA